MKTNISPAALFHHKNKKKNELITFKESMGEWEKCDDQEKLYFILEAIKIGLKSPHYNEEPRFILHKITSQEILLYIRHKHLEKPPDKPYLMAAAASPLLEDIPSKTSDFVKRAKQNFAQLTFNEQLIWFQKFNVVWEEFDKRLAELTPFDLAAYRKAYHKELIPHKVSFVKHQKREWQRVPMPGNKVHFKDEPKPPPLHPRDLAALVLQLDKSDYQNRKLKIRLYEKLSPVIKTSIIEKVLDFREEYSEALLKYVEKMDIARRRIYLGQKRDVIYQLLSMDPFEDKYPCKKYPVYRLGARTLQQEPLECDLQTNVDSHDWTKSQLLSAIRDSMAQLDLLAQDLSS